VTGQLNMKLRIKGNTLRLRLLRSEIERLSHTGVVTDEIRFGVDPGQALKYSIASTDGVEVVTAQFDDSQILIMIPESEALDWTTTERVGIEATQDVGGNTVLSILMEKDFECTSRPDDSDRADAFPNPTPCS
jgi:hypothetical protein